MPNENTKEICNRFGILYNNGWHNDGGLGSGYSSGIIHSAHSWLPIYEASMFNFYRVINFNDNFYDKTASELHNGNLRLANNNNRYSQLFPGQKLSYWASSVAIAKKEVFQHDNLCWHDRNYILFHAYDDASSSYPTIYPPHNIIVIDGTRLCFEIVLDKIDNNEPLNNYENFFLNIIRHADVDCLAYKPHAHNEKGGVNYLFFEKGFKKLSLRCVYLYLHGKKRNFIQCAGTSDYSPFLKRYGEKFLPIAKKKMDDIYLQSNEYKHRQSNYNENIRKRG